MRQRARGRLAYASSITVGSVWKRRAPAEGGGTAVGRSRPWAGSPSPAEKKRRSFTTHPAGEVLTRQLTAAAGRGRIGVYFLSRSVASFIICISGDLHSSFRRRRSCTSRAVVQQNAGMPRGMQSIAPRSPTALTLATPTPWLREKRSDSGRRRDQPRQRLQTVWKYVTCAT
jgi:hypothetical protein